jgi:uncharacterized protein YutE (UPF0331/DUF86 family)
LPTHSSGQIDPFEDRIEVLAAEGHVTPTEADLLRRLAESRNHLIHGGLETSVPEADLQRFIDVLKTLCNSIL